jgi:hypothetical protein
VSIDLSLDEVADGLHLALGAIFVLVPASKGWHHGVFLGSILGIVYGVIKEFWFDLRYESLETSGGIRGGVIDLCGYIAGIALANLILVL